MLAEDSLAWILPEPVTMLGQTLQPFSLGHAIWLQRLGIENIDNEADLYCAVLVCCHKWDEIRPALGNKWVCVKAAIWRCVQRGFDFDKLRKAFLDYSAIQEPECYVKNSRATNLPYLISRKSAAQCYCGYTRREVFDAPINELLLDVAAYFESQSALTVLDGNPDELFAAANAIPDSLIDAARQNLPDNARN